MMMMMTIRPNSVAIRS